MKIKFFLYEKETGQIFLTLPGAPDNLDTFEEDTEILYAGIKRASGVKWHKADWELLKEPVEVEPGNKMLYDEKKQEIINTGESDEF